MRERDVVRREREATNSPWLNPLVIAVFVAALGLLGNSLVAFFNNLNSQKVERQRAQSNLVFEAIKTGSQDAACKNLVFFVDLGLLDDPNKAIREVCKAYSKGAPSLPASNLSDWRAPVERQIRGVVQDADTGKAISGATISYPMLLSHITTDDNGAFSFEPPTQIFVFGQMRVEKDGYADLEINLPLLSPTQLILKMRKLR